MKEVSDRAEFERIVKGPGLVVADFFAHWCGPCKMIAPFLEELHAKFPDVTFIKVDVDKSEWAGELGVSAMVSLFRGIFLAKVG